MPVRIVEGKLPYTGGTGIGIDANKVISLLLRDENNLIQVNEDNEVYTDLQLADGIEPTDTFPVGVTVGKVLQSDGWTQNGIILNYKTTSGDYCRWIYANDGELYFDKGNGVWTHIYYSNEVDTLLANLRTEIYDYFIRYQDYYRVTKSGNQFNLELSCEITPDQNFVVDAPSNIEEGQTYVLRVHNGATSYVMSLGAYISNPKNTSIALNPNTTDTFVFLAIDNQHLELQPIADPNSSVNDGILTIQKNNTTIGTFTANQATNSTINVEVPVAVDNLTSTSTTQPLSANQGRELKSLIDDLAGFGKFLSLWNSATGQPISFPLATPYTYNTGDYFVVETVDSTTNYRPSGSSYNNVASTTVETDEVEVGDVYVYDGSVWLLQSNHGKTVTFANIAGQPTDNTNLATALNAKQDVLTAGSNITIDPNTNTISANNTQYSSATSTVAGIVKLGDDTVQTDPIQSPSATTGKTYPVQVDSNGKMNVNVPRANTTYSSLPAVSGGTDVSLVTTGEKDTWNDKQDTMSAGTGIDITNNVISNDGVTSVNGNTGAVTVETPNVKMFNFPDVGDDISEIISLAEDNGLPFVLKGGSDRTDGGVAYIMTFCGGGDLFFVNEESGVSRHVEIAYNTSTNIVISIAETVRNYGVPTSGTTGQVLTKTANGHARAAAPATGIQNDTTGTTTTVEKIWAGTEAEYNALSSHDANTIYHLY